MMYKNSAGTSTDDWIRLNFNQEYGPLIALVMGEDFDALERLGRPEDFDMEEPVEPVEPDSDDFTSLKPRTAASKLKKAKAQYAIDEAAHDVDLAAYKKALEAHEEAVKEFEEELYGFPVAWNCMWSPRENIYDDQIDALIEAGFIVYAVSKHTDIPYGFDHVFGVDGGGYSFNDQHWKPLRAIVSRNAAKRWLGKSYGSAEETVREHNDLVTFLANESRNSEGEAERFIRAYSLAMPETAAAE